MCEPYNGWKNRETWAAALWLSNEYGTYRTAQELASKGAEYLADFLQDDRERLYDALTSDSSARRDPYLLYAGDGRQALAMYAEIGSLYRVDWDAVARSLTGE